LVVLPGSAGQGDEADQDEHLAFRPLGILMPVAGCNSSL
jgi:hypothetical protein